MGSIPDLTQIFFFVFLEIGSAISEGGILAANKEVQRQSRVARPYYRVGALSLAVHAIMPLRDNRAWQRETTSSPSPPNPLSTDEGQLPRTILSLLSSEINRTLPKYSKPHVQRWYRLR